MFEKKVNFSTPSNNDNTDIVITLEPSRKKLKLGTLFQQYNDDNEEGLQLISPEQIFNAELDRYLSALMLDQEENVIPWWREYSSTYTFLSKMAWKYLSLCATSSASKCLFSTSGNVVTPARSTLKLDKG